MANVDRPSGLKPVGTIGAANWNGKVNMYVVNSANDTAIFVGDLVKLAGTGGDSGEMSFGLDTEGLPEILQSAAGDKSVGVVVGFLPNQDNLMQKYAPSENRRVALVSDDPNTVYEIQEVTGGTALTSAEIGLNANVIVAAGNTVTGLSGMELDNTQEASTAGFNCQILGLAKRVDNVLGEHAKWLVKLNDHEFSVGQTGS